MKIILLLLINTGIFAGTLNIHHKDYRHALIEDKTFEALIQTGFSIDKKTNDKIFTRWSILKNEKIRIKMTVKFDVNSIKIHLQTMKETAIGWIISVPEKHHNQIAEKIMILLDKKIPDFYMKYEWTN